MVMAKNLEADGSVRSVERAARLACWVMAVPQAVVIAILLLMGHPWHALFVGVLLAVQGLLMIRFLRNPVKNALWYSGIGVPFYVSGMMISAFALRFDAGVAGLS